jgi:ABC-type nitrate/sulfonate/bicarbonate transport system permease component
VLDPFVSALYATPPIAILPLLMIWFGIGFASKIAIVFLGAVFPILVNTITGVRTIDADFVKVARPFGCNDRQLFVTVALPSSVPLLLSGLRLGLGHALIGIVVGERRHARSVSSSPCRARAFRPTRSWSASSSLRWPES